MAKHNRKTIKKLILLSGLTVLAAATFEFNAFSNNDHLSSQKVSIQEPHIQQIQKQVLNITVLNSENEKYTVQAGDTYKSISVKYKPKNVKLSEYITLIKNSNLNAPIITSQVILLPNKEDLQSIMTDEVIKFDYTNPNFISHLKEQEGSKKYQSTTKRRLLNGTYGYSYKNSKFYPYRDSYGNYTIGFGHYISRNESVAMKYKNGISTKEAHDLLLEDLKVTDLQLTKLLQEKNVKNLSPYQERVLFEMTFMLGSDKLSKFHTMWSGIKTGNHKKVKQAIVNSLWYRQVPNRAELLVNNL